MSPHNLDSLARRIADRWCSEFIQDVLNSKPAELSAAEFQQLQVKLLRLCSERLAVAARAAEVTR